MIRNLAVYIAILTIGLGPALAGEPAKPHKDETKLKEIAVKVARTMSKRSFEAFERKFLVDRERYLFFYAQRHNIEIVERGWREFTGGIKENFEKKQTELLDPNHLEFRKVVFGEEGGKKVKFETCEIWAAYKTKDEKKPGELILHLIKIKGEWKVTSLE